MYSEHEIIGKIMHAKTDTEAADDLVKQYMPFIKKEVSKLVSASDNDYDDFLSVAMFSFYESVLSYSKSKGAFLSFASVVIRNRLIDYHRTQKRYIQTVSLDTPQFEESCESIIDRYNSKENNIDQSFNLAAAGDEIKEYSETLLKYGLKLSNIADNCPKQKRTVKACMEILDFARKDPEIMDNITATKKLPVALICKGTGIERKLVERHRRYLLAILIAYTNGFEIIRGHLKQIGKGVESK
ncbi:MAG: sigma-70 family RNA polymerase sigma factor [Clostridia bacterium]|nr:sigma-70 family RNA polymerase sigma factor [Clostridia bacterium]